MMNAEKYDYDNKNKTLRFENQTYYSEKRIMVKVNNYKH
jgi:hypothetical protein